jgi:aspartyl-tRNA(Asn)/glutamyl-tRNA(Gln) amidotransferase subunit A
MQRTTAIETARRLRDGSLDAVELIEATLDRIARDPDQAVFIDRLPAARPARGRGRPQAPARRSAPPGRSTAFPIGWKDLFDIEGRVTLAGSDDPEERPAGKGRCCPRRRRRARRDWSASARST